MDIPWSALAYEQTLTRRTYSRLERVEIPFGLEVMTFRNCHIPTRNFFFFLPTLILRHLLYNF